jgi:hypothetical protein
MEGLCILRVSEIVVNEGSSPCHNRGEQDGGWVVRHFHVKIGVNDIAGGVVRPFMSKSE